MTVRGHKPRRRWIKPLPKQLINKIAAGEVVERPAAVVKELVENSFDSGADQLDVTIEKSGTRMIRIVDNGCGIPREQIEIAFSRHATSKIMTFDDLNELASYGFRGEALPSIASVARLRMVSRADDSDLATEVIYEGGVLQSIKPLAAPPGTTVEVEDLFYNTPARRKFLKSDSTEARYISRLAVGLAMGRADVGFSLTMNGRRVFSVPSGSSLKDRVSALLGPGKRFVPVAGEAGPVTVEGYVGTPDQAQRNRYGLYLFINSRYVQSPTITHAVALGYGELLPKGNYPVGGVLLTINPREVDVNVHPAKTEVRLSQEREIHDGLYHLVKEALRRDGIIPSFRPRQATTEGGQVFPSRPDASQRTDSPRRHPSFIPGRGERPAFDPEAFARLHDTPEPAAESAQTGGDVPTTPPVVQVDTRTGEVIDEVSADGPSDGFRLVGRFSDLYLLLQSGDNLYIVDQHTAHERVLYEEFMRKVDEQAVNGQQLLFPAQVELSPEQLAVFDDAVETLNASGFTVAGFGGRTVNIEAVPAVLSRRAPERVFLKILDDLGSLQKAGYDLKKALAQSMACRSAVMAGDRLTDNEATGLLERLLQCENAYSCPHGRPTFIKLSREDIDRQFGRG